MGLFPNLFNTKTATPVKVNPSLAKLLQPETPTSENETGAQAVVAGNTAKEETIKDLMGKIDLTGKPAPVSETSKPVAPTLAEEISAPPAKVEAPVEIPAAVEAKIEPKAVEVKTAPVENKDSKYSAIELCERKFIYMYLREIHEITEKGAELVQATEEKDKAAENKKAADETNNILREDGKQIEASLKAFAEADDNQSEEAKGHLTSALTSFQNYLTAFEKKILDMNEEDRRTYNAIIVKIKAKKEEINKLINVVGTQLNFDRIKSYVKGAMRISEIVRENVIKGNVTRQTQEMVSLKTMTAVLEDRHGTELLAFTGEKMSVIDVLMKIFTSPTENK